MEDFKWVEALSSCTLSTAFESLKLKVQEDVVARNKQLKAIPSNYTFKFLGNGSSFVVAVEAIGIAGKAVKFNLTDSAISVVGPKDEKLFEATLTLNDDGECLFLIGGEEKSSWHLRKRALTQLFFTDPFLG